jgi:hypothetical protein
MSRRQSPELKHRDGFYFAAILAHASTQSFARVAERSVSPAKVLRARIAFPSLQYPLRGIIDDPPSLIELGHEPI